MTQFVCKEYPSIEVSVCGRSIKFKNGLLDLTDEDEIADLENQIATRPAISSVIFKVDREAAEEIARKHQAEQLRQTQAAKGTFTSEHAKAATRPETAFNQAIAETDEETADQLRKQMEQEGLMTTVAAEAPEEDKEVAATEPEPAPPAPAEEAKKAGKILGAKK